MSNNDKPTPDVHRELLELLDALKTGSGAAGEVAARLIRLGVRARGSTRPRGTVWTAAATALPSTMHQTVLLTVLRESTDIETLAAMALAIGEWGGEESVETLAERYRVSSDASVRECCIRALGTIGGPAAMNVSLDALEPGDRPEDALPILESLENLLTGGRLEDTDSAFEVIEPPAEFADALRTVLTRLDGVLTQIVERASSDPRWTAALPKVAGLRDLIERALGARESNEQGDDRTLSADDTDALLADLEGLTLEPDDPAIHTIMARLVVKEAMQLLSSLHFTSKDGASREGAYAAVAIQVEPEAEGTRVTITCRSRRDLPVNWEGLAVQIAGGDDNWSRLPPFFDAAGSTTIVLDRGFPEPCRIGPPLFIADAVVAEVLPAHAAGLPEDAASQRPLRDDAHMPADVVSANEGFTVRLTQHPGGAIKVRVDVVDPVLVNGTAHLSFRRQDGSALEFLTVIGEPVDMTVALKLEDKQGTFGEWMANVTLPKGTVLHVIAFPRRTP